jgi:hypothetical protein
MTKSKKKEKKELFPFDPKQSKIPWELTKWKKREYTPKKWIQLKILPVELQSDSESEESEETGSDS